jgi:glycosyltransferase involved in cell wall biosynthesis
MKIAIYSPYLDTAGGGEKYMMSIAEVLSKDHQVDVLLDKHLLSIWNESIVKRIEQFHNLDLSKANFIPAPFGIEGAFFKRLTFLKNYDYLFLNTDGSLFYSTAKNNIVHFQIPFENTVSKSLWGQMKLKTWQKAIYNSKFTKDFIEKNWSIRGEVIYPPVAVGSFKALKKKNQIVSVGRFSAHTKVKKHQVLIGAFKKLVSDNKLNGWSLHIAGGAQPGDQGYLADLKREAEGYKIELHPNITLEELKKLYGESKLYWHAMGYGEEDPKNFEHFGITTVEAMASGCVPVVIKKGGQLEIVEDGENGFLWETLPQLEEKTLGLIDNDRLLEKFSENSRKKSKEYSEEKFKESILKLING